MPEPDSYMSGQDSQGTRWDSWNAEQDSQDAGWDRRDVGQDSRDVGWDRWDAGQDTWCVEQDSWDALGRKVGMMGETKRHLHERFGEDRRFILNYGHFSNPQNPTPVQDQGLFYGVFTDQFIFRNILGREDRISTMFMSAFKV